MLRSVVVCPYKIKNTTHDNQHLVSLYIAIWLVPHWVSTVALCGQHTTINAKHNDAQHCNARRQCKSTVDKNIHNSWIVFVNFCTRENAQLYKINGIFLWLMGYFPLNIAVLRVAMLCIVSCVSYIVVCRPQRTTVKFNVTLTGVRTMTYYMYYTETGYKMSFGICSGRVWWLTRSSSSSIGRALN